MRALYRRIKTAINFLLDRAIDGCSSLLLIAKHSRAPIARSIIRRIARRLGDIAWLLRDLPRLPAYRLTGPEWSLVFVGGEHGLLEVRNLIFEGQAASQETLGRVALWRLSAHTERWLAGGVDLIVCEISRAFPWRLKARLAFSIPTWVQQVIAIPTPPEKLLSGKHIHATRSRINRANKNGFGYRFTRSKEEFDRFYHRMYVPFIRGRHGSLAWQTSYDRHLNHWFRRGGLVLVTQNDQPVAGTLCYRAGETYYDVEGGVLDNDPHLIQQGMNALLFWYAVLWAHANGAKQFNMGYSRAWLSDGAFDFKQRWGARVVGPTAICAGWTFLAREMPAPLRARLNQIRFIAEIRDRFYSVLLEENAALDRVRLDEETAAARESGLDGVVVVSPDDSQSGVAQLSRKEI